MIIIINFRMGNLRSIQYKLRKMGFEAVISSNIHEIQKAEKIILPGVGHFGTGMANLEELGLIPVLNEKVLEQKTPVLGICLGMQLLTNCSEEGNAKGLGWIDGETKRFHFDEKTRLSIPHVGWNTLQIRKESFLLTSVEPDQRFYFTHSYHISCHNLSDVVATTSYGYDFVSVVQRENIFGTQFHPEKSHRRGSELFVNFLKGG